MNMPTLSGDPKLEAMNFEGQNAWIKKNANFLRLFERTLTNKLIYDTDMVV